MYTFLAETGGNNNCIIENIFLDKITMCPLGRWKLIPGIVEMQIYFMKICGECKPLCPRGKQLKYNSFIYVYINIR